MSVVGNFFRVLSVVGNIFFPLSLVGQPHSHPFFREFQDYFSIFTLFLELKLSFSFISNWSYENRVRKHFVIFRNFPCLIAWHMLTMLFAYVVFFFFFFFFFGGGGGVFWLGICVEVDVDRFTILPPSFRFFSLPTILSLTQVTVIWNQRAPKAGFGAV